MSIVSGIRRALAGAFVLGSLAASPLISVLAVTLPVLAIFDASLAPICFVLVTVATPLLLPAVFQTRLAARRLIQFLFVDRAMTIIAIARVKDLGEEQLIVQRLLGIQADAFVFFAGTLIVLGGTPVSADVAKIIVRFAFYVHVG